MEVQQLRTLLTLRGHDWVSFNAVRKLIPSVYRFRILNADEANINEYGLNVSNESTRVGRGEPVGEHPVFHTIRSLLIYNRSIPS